MYDINLKVIKKGRGFWYIFLAVGLIFFIILGLVIFSWRVPSYMTASIKSSSVEIIEDYDSYEDTMYYSKKYNYYVDGEHYVCNSSFSSNVYPSQENVEIYYDKSNPSDCRPDDSDTSALLFMGIFLILPSVFIILALVNLIKINKRINKVKELNEVGRLVKGLPYKLENTGMSVNDVPIQRPVIDFTLKTGEIIKLKGDGRFDGKLKDEDGLVDLVIDEFHPDNYFIDFEINRVGGNQSSDYYQQPNQDSYSTNYNTFR